MLLCFFWLSRNLSQNCLSSNLFVASVISELSILTAGSDNTFLFELSGFFQGVSMLNCLYQDASEFKNLKNPISTSRELLLHWVNTRWKPSWHPEYLMAMNSMAGENANPFRVFSVVTAVCALAVLETCQTVGYHKSKFSLSRLPCSSRSPGNSCEFITIFLFF